MSDPNTAVSDAQKLQQMSYKELQNIAMLLQLPANLKHDMMVTMIQAKREGQEDEVNNIIDNCRSMRAKKGCRPPQPTATRRPGRPRKDESLPPSKRVRTKPRPPGEDFVMPELGAPAQHKTLHSTQHLLRALLDTPSEASATNRSPQRSKQLTQVQSLEEMLPVHKPIAFTREDFHRKRPADSSARTYPQIRPNVNYHGDFGANPFFQRSSTPSHGPYSKFQRAVSSDISRHNFHAGYPNFRRPGHVPSATITSGQGPDVEPRRSPRKFPRLELNDNDQYIVPDRWLPTRPEATWSEQDRARSVIHFAGQDGGEKRYAMNSQTSAVPPCLPSAVSQYNWKPTVFQYRGDAHTTDVEFVATSAKMVRNNWRSSVIRYPPNAHVRSSRDLWRETVIQCPQNASDKPPDAHSNFTPESWRQSVIHCAEQNSSRPPNAHAIGEQSVAKLGEDREQANHRVQVFDLSTRKVAAIHGSNHQYHGGPLVVDETEPVNPTTLQSSSSSNVNQNSFPQPETLPSIQSSFPQHGFQEPYPFTQFGVQQPQAQTSFTGFQSEEPLSYSELLLPQHLSFPETVPQPQLAFPQPAFQMDPPQLHDLQTPQPLCYDPEPSHPSYVLGNPLLPCSHTAQLQQVAVLVSSSAATPTPSVETPFNSRESVGDSSIKSRIAKTFVAFAYRTPMATASIYPSAQQFSEGTESCPEEGEAQDIDVEVEKLDVEVDVMQDAYWPHVQDDLPPILPEFRGHNNQISYPMIYRYLANTENQIMQTGAMQHDHSLPRMNNPSCPQELQQPAQDQLSLFQQQPIYHELQSQSHQFQGQLLPDAQQYSAQYQPQGAQYLELQSMKQQYQEQSQLQIQQQYNAEYQLQQQQQQPDLGKDVPHIDDAMLTIFYEQQQQHQQQQHQQQQHHQQQPIRSTNLQSQCRYYDNGCKASLRPSQYGRHVRQCEYQTLRCPMDACHWGGRLRSLGRHVNEAHCDEINKGSSRSFTFTLHKLRAAQQLHFAQQTRRRLFILSVTCRGSQLCSAIQEVVRTSRRTDVHEHDDAPADASLEMVGQDGRPHSWHGRPRPVQETEASLFAARRCLVVTLDELGVYAGASLTLHSVVGV